jgi:hypothetical protein
MAKRVFAAPSQTYAATADGLLTASNYMGLAHSVNTMVTNIIEVYMGGIDTSSTIAKMVLARSSTVSVTPTALSLPNSDGPMHGASLALATPVLPFVTAGTQPNRSPAATVARLNLAFNSFGGIVRWVAAPGEEWTIFGNAVNVSESTLSNFTGGGTVTMSGSIVYEPF